MKTNVGGVDRLVRVVLGALLLVLAGSGVIGAWGWIGVVPLATGVFRFCPLYTVLGIRTCPVEHKEAQ
ncbi:YgaP family membrane protein [Chitinibacteraceae bacterium HSL-7]